VAHFLALSAPQTEPRVSFTDEERDALTVRIQNGGTEVVEAKAGAVRLPNVSFSQDTQRK